MMRKHLSGLLLPVMLMIVSAVPVHLAHSADAPQVKQDAPAPQTEKRHSPGDVNLQRLRQADAEPGEWLANGRDVGGSNYSPLKQINSRNVANLGFVWQFKTKTYRGMEATPLAIDGVVYVSGMWGAVYAMDAASGRQLWAFDPHSDPNSARWGGED